MGKVAIAITGLKERTWVEVLADKVFGFQDISIDDLELVFDEYYKNEVEAKAFMVLPEPIQRKRILNVLERIGSVAMHDEQTSVSMYDEENIDHLDFTSVSLQLIGDSNGGENVVADGRAHVEKR
ncbi:uncharacterized protein A4U43_C09F13290 [Asparagus officinalis]|uniref:Uncharacterized protein n=1 Tax=Asparagus officinalis TaxID=4686 RepID=A0A5P1E759_ASPOF|nr:uncharacterized protein A4U43_C09F13290 [Asparagus officinalis]